MKRGLRPSTSEVALADPASPETHPDEEGIKTLRGRSRGIELDCVRRPTPDEEGIKTA